MTKEEREEYEVLVAGLRAMKVVTGLCRTEKEMLDKAADFIEERLEEDD